MTDDTSPTGLLDMTVGIVANYVSNNAVSADALPSLIASVHGALAKVGTEAAPAEEAVERPSAVQVRRSVSDSGIVSFLDGRTYQSLKRHLSSHSLTPDDYRARFGLRSDYPMVSPAYAARRSALAKAAGLGQKGRQPKAASKPGAARKTNYAHFAFSTLGAFREQGRNATQGRAEASAAP